ncbi:MAG TPA: EamA family transporter [Jiangellaceae bacterium]
MGDVTTSNASYADGVTARASLPERLRPELFFVGSAIFHYLGPAFAVLLFVRIDPLGVAWLRILSAGIVLALWRRPWRAWAAARSVERRTVVAWAAVLALMNASFYLAIDRLPLGTVAAIEFAGPILLAAVALRNVRNLAALALAAAGVAALADVSLRGSPTGFVFAVVNMALFVGYIVIAHRVSRHEHLAGIDGLAMAMVVAAALAVPIGIVDAAPAFADAVALGAAIGVGITSSVIPYVLDQLAMRRLARSTYALMVALLPATATVIGVIVLTQIPTIAEIIGVVLVVAAVILHREAEPAVKGCRRAGKAGTPALSTRRRSPDHSARTPEDSHQ